MRLRDCDGSGSAPNEIRSPCRGAPDVSRERPTVAGAASTHYGHMSPATLAARERLMLPSPRPGPDVGHWCPDSWISRRSAAAVFVRPRARVVADRESPRFASFTPGRRVGRGPKFSDRGRRVREARTCPVVSVDRGPSWPNDATTDATIAYDTPGTRICQKPQATDRLVGVGTNHRLTGESRPGRRAAVKPAATPMADRPDRAGSGPAEG